MQKDTCLLREWHSPHPQGNRMGKRKEEDKAGDTVGPSQQEPSISLPNSLWVGRQPREYPGLLLIPSPLHLHALSSLQVQEGTRSPQHGVRLYHKHWGNKKHQIGLLCSSLRSPSPSTHQPIYSLARQGPTGSSFPSWRSQGSKRRCDWGKVTRQWGMVAQVLDTCLTIPLLSSLSHCLFTLKPRLLFTMDVYILTLICHIPPPRASTLLPALRRGRTGLTRAQRPNFWAFVEASLTDLGPSPARGCSLATSASDGPSWPHSSQLDWPPSFPYLLLQLYRRLWQMDRLPPNMGVYPSCPLVPETKH